MLKMLEWEEGFGKAWDRYLNKKASLSNKQAEVKLENLSKQLKIFYHLLGGDKAKQIKQTDKTNIKKFRNVVQKISGYGQSFFLPWQDENALYLPPTIAIFPNEKDNKMLYFWLVAMCTKVDINEENLKEQNQKQVNYLCKRYEGFKKFYDYASSYLLLKIPELEYIKTKNSLSEKEFPFFLWIYSASNKKSSSYTSLEEEELNNNRGNEKNETLKMKKKAKQIDDKKKTDGFMAFLPEGLMSILEQINVDRSEDDSFDKDALYNAIDLDEITLGQKKANLNSRIKMDLDLKTETTDEVLVKKGYLLKEWNYEKESYLEDYVCLKPIVSKNIKPIPLPKRLKKIAKKIQMQFDLMQINRAKNDYLPYGDELCLDTWIDYKGHENKSLHHQKFFENYEKKTKDIATLILADISLSTEAGITPEIKVIDMIKDGLMVFAEALEKIDDKFAIYAFSSKKNSDVRFHIIKNFKQKYSNETRGRIDAMTPGYYTRLGAAIRESNNILQKQANENKLLLIISDGKPNDLDRYDGRYGIEDCKKAIEELKNKGITPFCITIDLEAKDYLSYIFGKNNYTVVRDSKKLPKIIPEVYINLTK